MRPVRREALVLSGRLGQGGQGVVYAVANARAGGVWHAVYKEYRPELRGMLNAAALEALVNLVYRLSPEERAWLGERAAWPTELVTDAGAVCGFLMRMVPPEFSFTPRRLSTAGGTAARQAQAEFLLNSDDYVARIGLTVSERDRVALLADLARVLDQLHSFDIVVGDLSPKNLLFSVGPVKRCFLIDCDAMRISGETVLPQVETVEWMLPPGEELATRPGDVYKFGLLAARLFARDQSTRDASALVAAAPGLADLALASLRQNPAERPSARDWIAPLDAAALAASTAPARAIPTTPPTTPPVAPPTGGPAPRMPGAPAPLPTHRPSNRRAGVYALLAVVFLGLAIGIPLAVQHSASGQNAAQYNSTYNYSSSTDPFGGSDGYTGPGGSVSSDTSTDSPSTDNSNEAAELQAMLPLLQDSATSRTSINNAVNEVGACRMDPATGISALRTAYTARTTDSNRAQELAVDAIPQGPDLQSDLVTLLNDSATADQDFEGWMRDIQSQGCPVDTSSDSNYLSANQASQAATQAKQTFVALWNPLAQQFGLTTYTADQI